jgi:CSLREA domain-containing protein
MKRAYGLYITIALAAVLLLTVYATRHRVHAATLTVNSTADTTDVAPGDGVCADGLGNCTLRAAIQEANALAGLDTIEFNIGTGTPTIAPTSALPIITSRRKNEKRVSPDQYKRSFRNG